MAATGVGRLIQSFLPSPSPPPRAPSCQGFLFLPSPSSPPPPPPPRAPSCQGFLSPKPRQEGYEEDGRPFVPSKTSPRRRSALLFLLAFPSLAGAPSAAAFSIGVSGPKEWLREQKKRSAKFVLAPIDASRQSLRAAYLMLTSDSQSLTVDSEELRRLLNSAARDCVPQQRNSLVELQSRTGVEVCTFRLLVNNAASLLDKNDPVKLEAEATLNDLISSFSSLGTIIDNSSFQLTEDREKLTNGLMGTISTLDRFELGIKNCLGV